MNPGRWGMLTKLAWETPTELLPEPLTINALEAEMVRARMKFPTNRPLLIACAEELGELAKALAHGSRDDVEREAIQLASTALRIVEEGDATFEMLTDAERKP